jgi:hypothetical protein
MDWVFMEIKFSASFLENEIYCELYRNEIYLDR